MTTLQVLILVQLGGTLLLVVPFEFLNRRAGPRLYFRSWSLAWVAAFLSLFVLILRYNVLPHVWGRPLEDGEAAVRVAQIIYQTGKFTFLGLLLVGSIQHEGRGVSSRAYALGVAAIALLAPISVLLSTRVEQVVFWQCWVAIPVFAATGYRLLAAHLRAVLLFQGSGPGDRPGAYRIAGHHPAT